MVNSITLFGVALKGSTVPFAEVNNLATKVGYLVHPDCCTKEVFNWLSNQKADFNSTFYKAWSDITSKSRFELYLDQIRHYLSTYGTDYKDKTWVPNDGISPEFSFKEYKVIMPCHLGELCDRCEELCKSGIALSKETVEFCCSTIHLWWKESPEKEIRAMIESLTNKEAQAILYVKFNLSPIEKFALLRYIAYKQFGSAMIVQSDANFKQVKNPYTKRFDFTTLNETQIRNLSSIFLRYKKFFLSFKDKKNAPIINKMRRLAKKTHTPLQPGFWENILSLKPNVDDVIARAGEVSIFKLLTIATAIREHIQDAPGRGFLIRTQKYWYKEGYRPPVGMYELSLYAALVDYIKKSINVKVKLPKKFILTCPTSEKSFVGNYPFGTQYLTQDNNAFIGIYWRNEWGTRDFDLSYEDFRGRRIGWNASFYNEEQNVIFSGDMTNADPEATEILSFKGKVDDGIIKVNRYNGNENSRYNLILGQEDVHGFESRKDFSRNEKAYMVDPNNIDLRVECTSESRQDQIGIVSNGTIYLMKVQTGNQIVSNPKHDMLPMLLAKCNSYLPLSEIVTVVPEDYEGEDYIDLTGEIHKDDIINLLTIKN